MKCAEKVARCAAECSDSLGSTSCIICLGGSYQQCKGCFKREEAILQSNNMLGESSVVLPNYSLYIHCS